jgi:hypothetical protein
MLRSAFSSTVLAAAALLLGPSLAPAQVRSTGGSGLGMSGSSIGGSSIGGGGIGGSSIGGGGIGGSGLSSGLGSNSFAGSTANSFLGGSMSGTSSSQGFLGGSMTGGSNTGGSTGRGGSTTPGSTSFLGSNYTNPIAMGQPNSTSPVKFGTAMYNVSPTVATLPGQTTGRGTATVNQNQTNNGLGVGFAGKRPTNYTIGSISVGGLEQRTVSALPPPSVGARPDIQAALAQTPNFQGVNVLMDGDTVVLRGQIREDRDRRLAEMVARMSPGVRDVRNEIVVSTSP